MLRTELSRSGFRRQRGVALITAVLVVALATILAVDVASKGYLDQRRTGNLFVLDQGFEIALGAEAIAAEVLKQDAKNSKTQKNQPWESHLDEPILDGAGQLNAYLEDMQGRFNLNNLVLKTGAPNLAAIHQFQRLLERLNMDPGWAGILVDWIDQGREPSTTFGKGAEQNVYTAQTPPYLTADMRITRVSELLALPEFGLENYQKLEPLVAALPIGTKLNVCTAPALVIKSLSSTTDQNWPAGDCSPSLADLDRDMGADPGYQEIKKADLVGEKSDYFRANVAVTIGTAEFSMYSLLWRNNSGARAVLRSFGTP